jgi:hypothetical protein
MIAPALVVVFFFALLVTAADLYKVLDGMLIVYRMTQFGITDISFVSALSSS